MTDDPFERAAEREETLLRQLTSGPSLRPLIGLQLSWAVLLGLHWWVAGGDGRGLRIHAVAFLVGLAFVLFAVVADAGPRWGMFAVVAGWAPFLALHWVRVGERTLGTTIHTVVFGCSVAAAIITVFSTPAHRE